VTTPPAVLRVVLFADDTIVVESHDVELWRRLHGTIIASKRSVDRDLQLRWQAAAIRPEDRRLADAILSSVCTSRAVSLVALVGKSRKPVLVAARNLAMWMLRDTAGLSYAAIGGLFLRHHTSIMHSVRRITERMDDTMRAEVATIAAQARVQ
jgi:chromosomal replication initiation ATPase DnaA